MQIKFKPTGNIFNLPEEEARRIYIEDKGYNYEVLDGEIELDEEKTEETTVYNQIVDETTGIKEEAEKGENPKTLEDCTIPELKAKLDNLNIKYAKNAKKAELIALFSNETTGIKEEAEA